MLPAEWNKVKRILAVRLDNIGDVVMTGPALRNLHRALPRAHITMMVSPAGNKAAPLLPWVDDVLVHRAVWQDASWKMPLDPERESQLVAVLRARRFDAAVIFTSFSQSPYPPACACYLAGIPIRLGQSKEFGGSILSQWVRPLPDGVHQVDRNLHLLEAAGFTVEDRHLELEVPGSDQKGADGLLREVGVEPDSPFVVLAPGASCSARRYDSKRFAAVARQLYSETGIPIVVVGAARDSVIAEPILAGGRRKGSIVSLISRDTIPKLAGIIRRSSLLITNNSGPMHLGDAFRTPMTVLYSGTEIEEQWRPRSSRAMLLRRQTECSPCYLFQCPYRMECLDISPREVVEASLNLLEKARKPEALNIAADA